MDQDHVSTGCREVQDPTCLAVVEIKHICLEWHQLSYLPIILPLEAMTSVNMYL